MITMKAGLLVAAVGVSIFGWIALTMINDEPPPTGQRSQSSPMRRISVQLLGPVSNITGTAAPPHILAGERPRFFKIDESSIIEVKMPGGNKVSLPVKTAIITTEMDIQTRTAVVIDVRLLPLPKAVSYQEAKAELQRYLREKKIEPDEKMRQQLAMWPEDSGAVTYSAGMWLSESAGLGVELRPAGDEGWFLAVALAAHADAIQPLWDPAFKPARKAPAGDKN